MRLKKQKRETKQHTGLIGLVCICVGACCIILALGSLGSHYYAEKQLLASTLRLQRELQHQRDEAEGIDSEAGNVPAEESGNSDIWKGKEEILGSLMIPVIDLEVAVREGTDRTALRDAVGHLTGTAPIGEVNGNCVIAGHRNYSFGRFFNRLDEVEANDRIVLTNMSGEQYVYRVTEKKVVSPDDTSVLEAAGGGELTLITCTPIYIATHRLIVHCELIPEKVETPKNVIQNGK